MLLISTICLAAMLTYARGEPIPKHRHHESSTPCPDETDPPYPFSLGSSASVTALSTGGTLRSGVSTYVTHKASSTSPPSSISFPYGHGSSFPSGSGSAAASGNTLPQPSFTTAPASGVSSGSLAFSSDPVAPYGNSSAASSGTAYSSGSALYTSSKGTAAAYASISPRYPYSFPSGASQTGSPTSFDPSSRIAHSSGSSIRTYPYPNGTAAGSTLPASSGFAVSSGSGLYSYRFPTGSGTAAPSSLSDPSTSKKYPYSLPNITVVATSGISGSSGPTVRSGTRGYPIITGTAVPYNSSTKHYPYSFTNSSDPSGTAISGSASGIRPTGLGTISKDPTSAKGTAAATSRISSSYIYSYPNGTGASSHSTPYLSSSKPSGAAASSGIGSGKPSITANSTDPTSGPIKPTHGPYPFPSSFAKPSLVLSASGSSIYANSSASVTLTAITDYFPTAPFTTDPGSGTAPPGTGTAVPPPPTIGTAISTFKTSSPTSADENSKFTYTPTTKLMPSEYYTHHGKKGRKLHHKPTPAYEGGYGYDFDYDPIVSV